MNPMIEKLDRQWIEENIDLATPGAVVLFDIDSTIMNTSPRNFAILKDAENHFSFLDGISRQLGPYRMGWNICDDVEPVRPLSPDEKKKLHEFWSERFFFDPWVRLDTPYPGVQELLGWLEQTGVRLVYLTGRDSVNMAGGTIEAFRSHGIPSGEKVTFLFKPTQETEDLPFKKRAFEEINRMGRVVLAVENEPANANAMLEAFPAAAVALIETITAPDPARPRKEIIRFKGYT